MKNHLILKGYMDYENTKEQAICCSITYLWVLAGTYRQRCNSISILCVYRNTVVLCKRKLDLLRIEPLTTPIVENDAIRKE